MSDKKQSIPEDNQKGGYQPLNDGYQPATNRGYSPETTTQGVPPLPKGGSAQSQIVPEGDSNN